MARIRAWSTMRFNEPDNPDFGTFDLLSGTGLAVEGATVQRNIGRLDTEFTRGLGQGLPRCELGIIVGTEPADATIFADSDVPWLFYASFVLGPQGASVGDRVATDFSSSLTGWDVEGQRTLAAGETVWLAYQLAFEDETDNTWLVVANRSLVLGPETA